MNIRKESVKWIIFVVMAALLAACSVPGQTTQPATEPVAGTAAIETIPAEPQAASQAKPVIIDTDMAIDDWMAILYLLQRMDISVIAITVSGTGEAHCDAGVKNALGLLALAGYEEIPVTCGRETPLKGDHTFPLSWRTNVDNLSGLTLPEGGSASSSSAVELLTSLIQSSPAKVTIMTLGPLTNLAETLLADPSLKDNIERVYIMGGAVNVPGNIAVTGVGIKNDAAEWNIYIDPYAAQVVFESGAPITLVALDATNDVLISEEFFKALKKNHTTPEAGFIYDLFSKNNYLYESGTLYFWDQLTAVILSDESVAAYEEDTVCVLQNEGIKSGQTVSRKNCPQIRVAVSADRENFERIFLDTLNNP